MADAAAARPSPPSPELLQHLIDQAAHLNVLSVAANGGTSAAIGGKAGVVGVRIQEAMHRLDVSPTAPTTSEPVRASNRVGEELGRFEHLWMLAPESFVAAPGKVPPPTPIDPSRPQRLVMLDSRCRLFSGSGDGFRGFGTGRTHPTTAGGVPRLLVTTVGTILEGSGRFTGHEAGTYMHCGELDPELGFSGNLLLRVMDPEGTLRSERSLPALHEEPSPEPDITYVVLRGEAVPSDPVSPNIGPDGRPIGLIVEQGLRLLFLDASVRESRGVRTTARVGQTIGRITAHVVFDPTVATGTALDPVPFTTWDQLLFHDTEGRPLGGFTAESSEGRVFNLSLAGQQAIRFGGTGAVLKGEGLFTGIEGLMTDNSVVVFEPHVSASVYLLRLHDPDGRFRIALGGVS